MFFKGRLTLSTDKFGDNRIVNVLYVSIFFRGIHRVGILTVQWSCVLCPCVLGRDEGPIELTYGSGVELYSLPLYIRERGKLNRTRCTIVWVQ
ncbi:hypothetical protein GDO81_005333 [Engystomops pustulosus]|uniref:Uncharacterized protein n=1 Tax=Engystomops pustulosus TaxID=76066 RepID=A0AAV7CP44_ENGPU|nr:hypothetical protein GDO81_005333 [Engystomops pustulosus]